MTKQRSRFPVIREAITSPKNLGAARYRGGGTIPWWVAEEAYKDYIDRWGGEGQSLERVAERGGFGASELDVFYPDWIEHWEGGTDNVPIEWREHVWKTQWPKDKVPWPYV